jgi:hypothetical protein
MSLMSKFFGRKERKLREQPAFTVVSQYPWTVVEYDPKRATPMAIEADLASRQTELDIDVTLVDDEPTRPYHRISTVEVPPVSDELIAYMTKVGETK